jgi:hypothetical protein
MNIPALQLFKKEPPMDLIKIILYGGLKEVQETVF